jgi:hypothetical protein
MIVSAYLSILDDWDILKPSLLSILDRVDEIIVVDGAYRWMLPYFEKSGRDPTRSLPPVYDVLASLGEKIRVINGIWDNEVEKRIAGYEACKGRYRYRVDADEIFFFDDAILDEFFNSDKPVGQMDMPIYVAPGLISGADGKPLPRQAFLFDSNKISSREHLSYLWLVLPEWERTTFGISRSDFIFSKPLAFNAHLTHWRPPSSSLARARFYVMNYMRQHGAPFLMNAAFKKSIDDFTEFFEEISPFEFDEMLLGRDLIVVPSPEQFTCCTTPLTQAQEQTFSYIYELFLNSLGVMNLELRHSFRTMLRGENYYLDASLAGSLPLVGPDNTLVIEFSDLVAAVRVEVFCFFLDTSRNTRSHREVERNGRFAKVHLPPLLPVDGTLRRVITIAAWGGNSDQALKFRFPVGFG